MNTKEDILSERVKDLHIYRGDALIKLDPNVSLKPN